MSFISGTGANLAATTTTSVVSKVWDHSAGHANHLINFADNHESLSNKMVVLRSKMDHVKRRIHVDEASGMTRRPMVEAWLRRVEAVEHEVSLVLQEGAQLLQQRCLGGCCFQNWCKSYRLGKKISKKLPLVVDLISEGDFDVVADRSFPVLVQVKQESQTVGMDALFDKVRKLLGEDQVKMLGIYGMGGVGKTTLLKKLNNSLGEMGGKFDVVIWVVVSKEFNVRKVQKQIVDRLGLAWSEEVDEDTRAQHIFNVLRIKKFVVLLDDLWQQIELETIGIPSPCNCSYNSKVVFSTRLESVCLSMEVNEKVRVDVLDPNQAWILFQQKLGQEALSSHPEILEIAEEVLKECCGLPLAIITVGRAMAAKKSPQEWKHALKTLKKSTSEFSGMKEKVFAALKFSYDNLENDHVRSLFLYCSLFPEDYNIQTERLLLYWVGEEIVDEYEDVDDVRGMGYDMIGSLKAACLLETGDFFKDKYVRMHDLIRDLALWIGQECGEKKNKYLVQAGVGLTQAPNRESWKDAERISLMENSITKLPKPPHCPYLLSLLLQSNPLSEVAIDFFEYMPNLRVLDLSFTKIENIPKSIGCLVELQCLTLSSTNIQALPDEFAKLKKVRFLTLNHSPKLNNVPGEVISQLSRLQGLGLFQIGSSDGGNICYPSVEELESLEHLRWLSVTVRDSSTLKRICLSPILSSCLCYICIIDCQDLTQLELAPSLLLGNMKKMEYLAFEDCLELVEVSLDCSEENKDNMGLLLTLVRLDFHHLPKLNIIWNGETSTHLHFRNLQTIEVNSCDALKDFSWLNFAPDLRSLLIMNCEKVQEILVNGVAGTTIENQTIFSRLEILILRNLPKLESISRVALAFSSFASLYVSGCPLLKKLPFTSTSTSKPSLSIRGDTMWWDELEWEDQTVKSSFEAFFISMS